MAVGDVKGQEAVVIYVTAGATVTKGQLVHLESDDGKWDPTADADTGKFGVALEGGADTEEIAVLIYGRVEVTASGAVKKGQVCMAGNTGTVAVTDHGAIGENCGTAMEAAADAGVFTLFVGLVE